MRINTKQLVNTKDKWAMKLPHNIYIYKHMSLPQAQHSQLCFINRALVTTIY